MELDDAPLLSSWAATAADLFRLELQELATLSTEQQREDEAAAAAMRSRAEAEVNAALAMRPTTAVASGSGGGSLPSALSASGAASGASAKEGKTKKQQQHSQSQQRLKAAAQAIAAEQKAAKAAERAAMKEARLQEMQRLRDSEPWRQLTNELSMVIDDTQRTLGPVREREHQELDFFLAKPPEAFSMDEIVGTKQRHPLGTGDGAHHRDPGQGGHGGALASSAFVIDAGAFAEEYNDYLSREYGCKPVLSSSTPALSSSSAPARQSEEGAATSARAPGIDRRTNMTDRGAGEKEPLLGASTPAAPRDGLKQKLATHRPGRGTTPPPFCVPPSAVDSGDDGGARALASSLPPIGSVLPAADEVTAAECRREGCGAGLTSSMPQLPSLSKKAKHKAVPLAPSAARAKEATGRTGVPRESSKPTAALLLRGIECSFREKHLTLRAHTGTETTATVRFTNRNTNPTKLRLKPSSHPWLHFRCVTVAPVAGSSATTVASAGASAKGGAAADPTHHSYSVETTPLSCGGYLEVQVSFCPTAISQPVVEELLQVGVTRELNARDAEGSQWAFYEVAVRGETILPAFRLSRAPAPADDEAATAPERSQPLSASYTSYGSTEGSDFPPTFVFAHTTQHYTLENTGSDCLVHLCSSSPHFAVSPGGACATLLRQGEAVDVAVTFAPPGEGPWEATLTAEVREAAEELCEGEQAGDVLAEHTFALVGFGVVPRVRISRIADQLTSSLPPVSAATGAEGIAALVERAVSKYIAQKTSPEVPITLSVTVVNDSVVPLPFYWDLESIAGYDDGGGGDGDELMSAMPFLEMEPAVGVLPGDGVETTFRLHLTPRTTAPILSSLNLFLVGLPDAKAAPQDGTHPVVSADAAVVELLRKDKQLPSAYAAFEEFAMPGAFPPSGEDVLADPFAVFKPHFQQPQTESASASNRGATFAVGFFLFAKPIAPSVELMPPVLEETVECLTGLWYVREVVLRNPSPCAIHFLWDPTEEQRNGGIEPDSTAWQALARQKTRKPPQPNTHSSSGKEAVVEVFCLPRAGSIPSNGSATVQVHFSVATPGPHRGSLPLYVPELDRGLRHPPDDQCSPASATRDPRRSLLHFCVHVRGVGPSVHVSTELLDFGLVEFGGEAEASFTVTNDNPIPVVFDLQDPLMREPARFVFIPPSFRLASGDSVEVTVYRKAASMEDAQTYFEVSVRGGATIAIETRATIQKPTMMLDEATVNFGSVPEGVWQERCFYLTNLSALDMPFTVETAIAAATNSCVELELPTGVQTLRAGQKHCAVKVRARFTAAAAVAAAAAADVAGAVRTHRAAAASPSLLPLESLPSGSSDGAGGQEAYRVLLGIRSKRRKRTESGAMGAGQVLLLELCCDRVERLSLSVDVLSDCRSSANPLGGAGAPAMEAAVPIAAFVRALLHNLVEEGVLSASGGRDGAAAPRRNVSAGGPTFALSASNLLADSTASKAILTPYCATPTFRLTLSEEFSVCMHELSVKVVNHSGCLSRCAMTALCHAPFPIITSFPSSMMNTTLGRGHISRSKSRRGSVKSVKSTRRSVRTASTSGKKTKGTSGEPKPSAAMALTTQASSGMSAAVQEWAATFQPRFWTTASDGTEARARDRRADLSNAQQLLVDGHGCVTTLPTPDAHPSTAASMAEAAIGPYQTVLLPVSMMANLPGRYDERLRLACVGVSALMDIPVSLEVYGKPVLIDPTTSGLTTMHDGRDVLMMPPTVACLGSSRRTLKVVNRVPRDVNVSVEMFVSGSTFAVTAVDEDAEGSQVVLTLGSIPDAQIQEDKRRFGSATATPSAFFMPAMSTKEIHLEYVPDLKVVQHLLDGLRSGEGSARHAGASGPHRDAEDVADEGDDRAKGAMSQEVDWEGSLVLQAELAQSAFNDAFLMDEFYETHRARFPSTRTLTIVHQRSDAGDGTSEEGSDDGAASNDGRGSRGEHAGTRFTATGTQGAPGGSLGTAGAALRNMSKTASALQVVRPLITRPGMVVRNSKLLRPSPAEQMLVEHAQRKSESRVASAAPPSVGAVGGRPARCPTVPSFIHTVTDAKDEASLHDSPTDSSGGAESEEDEEGSGESDGPLAAGGGGGAVVGSAYDNPVLQAAAESGALRPVHVLLAEDEERRLLGEFLAARHDALRRESQAYFSPMELLLRARCGVPLLAVQPSETLIRFPTYWGGKGLMGSGASAGPTCRRTIRLTNHNSAALLFSLRLCAPLAESACASAPPASAAFRVVGVRLVPQLVEATPLAEDDEESRLAQKELQRLRWGDKAEVRRAERLMRTQWAKEQGATRRDDNAAAAAVVVETVKLLSTDSAGERSGPAKAAAATDDEKRAETVYCLNGADSLDVMVEYDPNPTAGPRSSVAGEKEKTGVPQQPATASAESCVTADFLVQFYSNRRGDGAAPASASASAVHPRGAANPAGRVAPNALQPGATQRVLLKVPLSTVRVSCSTSMLWFKPGQLTHDGRPQPSYPQRLTLFNRSKAPVQFALVPRSSLGAGGPASAHLTDVPPHSPARAATFKIKEVLRMPSAPCAAASSVGEDAEGSSAAAASWRVPSVAPTQRRDQTNSNNGRNDDDDAGGNLQYPFMTVKEATAVAAAHHTSTRTRLIGALADTVSGTTANCNAAITAEEAAALLPFHLSPAQGVIPAASRGGEPGSVEVEVTFTEFSNVRFEDEFVVLADGEPTEAAFTLRGDSRETEL